MPAFQSAIFVSVQPRPMERAEFSRFENSTFKFQHRSCSICITMSLRDVFSIIVNVISWVSLLAFTGQVQLSWSPAERFVLPRSSDTYQVRLYNHITVACLISSRHGWVSLPPAPLTASLSFPQSRTQMHKTSTQSLACLQDSVWAGMWSSLPRK